MISWDEAIKNGLFAFVNRDKYVYFYGAKGQTLTLSLMDYFINSAPDHFSKYSAEEIEQIKRNSLGKIGGDCSWFTGWICTGDRRYSKAQIENSSYSTNELAKGVAGSLLFTTYNGYGRHIGIDIGYGYYLHTAWESTDEAIKNHIDSICLDKINGGRIPWELSAMSNVIDYTGATNR